MNDHYDRRLDTYEAYCFGYMEARSDVLDILHEAEMADLERGWLFGGRPAVIARLRKRIMEAVKIPMLKDKQT